MSASKKLTDRAVDEQQLNPFIDQFACFQPDRREASSEKEVIFPEDIIGCLKNLASYEHMDTEKNVIVSGPSEWCMKLLSRVLRERPEIMLEAMQMQVGAMLERTEKRAMVIARQIVMTIATDDLAGECPPSQCLSCSELFEVMERHYPHLFQILPTSKNGLRDWKKKANLSWLQQSRGGRKSPAYRLYKKRILDPGLHGEDLFAGWYGQSDS